MESAQGLTEQPVVAIGELFASDTVSHVCDSQMKLRHPQEIQRLDSDCREELDNMKVAQQNKFAKRFRHHWHNAMVLSGTWRQNKAPQSQALPPTDEKAAGKSRKKEQRPSKQKRPAMFFSGVWPPRPKLSLGIHVHVHVSYSLV